MKALSFHLKKKKQREKFRHQINAASYNLRHLQDLQIALQIETF